jgi:hypothetical protein
MKTLREAFQSISNTSQSEKNEITLVAKQIVWKARYAADAEIAMLDKKASRWSPRPKL